MTENLDQLRQVAERATRTDWHPVLVGFPGREVWLVDSELSFICSTQVGDERGERDSLHIATFDPTTVLALIDRVQAVERELAEFVGTCGIKGCQRPFEHSGGCDCRALDGGEQSESLPAPRTITGEQVNRAGWTCYGIHEPGNYATCEECREACDDLANFYNNMHHNPVATKTWTGQPTEGGGE